MVHHMNNATLPNEGTLAVIGAGMCRTATKSLKVALETLYGQPCYHMTELLNYHKSDIAKWLEIFRLISEEAGKGVPAEVIHQIFQGYRCVTDLPACAIYKQLMECYPEAKIILTVRDRDTWIESLRTTVLPRKPRYSDSFIGLLVQWIIFGGRFQKMALQSMQLAMGPDVDLSDDDQLAEAFDRRNEEVKRKVPPDRLLVFNPRDGWEPLCQFLRLPIPDIPFPYINEREEIRMILKNVERKRDLLYFLFYSTFGVSIATVCYFITSKIF